MNEFDVVRALLAALFHAVTIAPTTDDIEVLQRETGRVDVNVTRRADGDVLVLVELLANGRRSADVGFDGLYVGRWW